LVWFGFTTVVVLLLLVLLYWLLPLMHILCLFLTFNLDLLLPLAVTVLLLIELLGRHLPKAGTHSVAHRMARAYMLVTGIDVSGQHIC
jgi:hypothetical protein